jgi:hypothetical protein
MTSETEYVVLSLRKCTRGLPLLPKESWRPAVDEVDMPACTDPNVNWYPIASEEFTLANYLKKFLQCIGVDVPIYDQMDGAHLVPYQAIVRRDEWSKAWNMLSGPFKQQRTAYRRFVGGRCAPEIVAGTTPRFVRESEGSETGPDERIVTRRESSQVFSPKDWHIPVKVCRTFVHYSNGSNAVAPMEVAATLEDLDLPPRAAVF